MGATTGKKTEKSAAENCGGPVLTFWKSKVTKYQPFREPTIMPLVKYFRMKG